MVFMDDIIIYSKTFKEHCKHIKEVLEKLQSKGLFVKMNKCQWLMEEINFLGHTVTRKGISVDEKKVETLNKLPKPEDGPGVRSFLGMAGYYRKFIRDFAKRTYHLRKLTKEGAQFKWTADCQIEFDDIRNSLMKKPVMAFPDFSRKFILTTDACTLGYGVILSQIFDEGERVIAYASKSTNEHEQRYPATELEAAAVIWEIDKFKLYLNDNPFMLVTNHKALTKFREISGKSAKLERWSLKLQDLKFDIQHRAGTKMPADYLSRNRITIVLNKTESAEVNHKDIEIFTTLDISKFLRSLENCKDFGPIIAKMKKMKNIIGKEGEEVELGTSKYDAYVLKKDGRLYHRMLGSKWDRQKGSVDRLCIPSRYRRNSLKEFHDRTHFAFKKVYKDMQRRVYWPGMYKHVKEYCEGCTTCQERNIYTQRTEGPLQPIEVIRRFELIHLDLFSGVPESDSGNVAALVITDHVTKFTVAVPIWDKTQQTIGKKFLTHWVKYFGFPERMLTDGGTEFDGIMK